MAVKRCRESKRADRRVSDLPELRIRVVRAIQVDLVDLKDTRRSRSHDVGHGFTGQHLERVGFVIPGRDKFIEDAGLVAIGIDFGDQAARQQVQLVGLALWAEENWVFARAPQFVIAAVANAGQVQCVTQVGVF